MFPPASGHVTAQVITLSGAIGLQSNCACLLGHLHLSQVSNSPRPGAGESSRQTAASGPRGQHANVSLVLRPPSASGLQLPAREERPQMGGQLPD